MCASCAFKVPGLFLFFYRNCRGFYFYVGNMLGFWFYWFNFLHLRVAVLDVFVFAATHQTKKIQSTKP
jgi:hypothetical protein